MKFEAFFSGITAYGRAFTFIGKHKLHRFFIVPGIFGFLFFLAMGIATLYLVPIIAEFILSFIPADLLNSVFQTLVKIFLYLLSGTVALISSRYVVMVVLSPVLSHLSEVTEEAMYGKKVKGPGILGMLSDVFRALRLNIRIFFRQLFFSILLSLIPFVNAASPFTLFIVESYYAGFNLMDFTLERKRMRVRDSIKFVRKNRMLTTGLGIVFSLLIFIPVLGWMMAPVLGTVAATLETLKEMDGEQGGGGN